MQVSTQCLIPEAQIPLIMASQYVITQMRAPTEELLTHFSHQDSGKKISFSCRYKMLLRPIQTQILRTSDRQQGLIRRILPSPYHCQPWTVVVATRSLGSVVSEEEGALRTSSRVSRVPDKASRSDRSTAAQTTTMELQATALFQWVWTTSSPWLVRSWTTLSITIIRNPRIIITVNRSNTSKQMLFQVPL